MTTSPAWVAAVSRLIVAALIVTSTGAASMRGPDGQQADLKVGLYEFKTAHRSLV